MKPIAMHSEKQTFHLILRLAKLVRGFQDEAVFCENVTYNQFAVLDFVADAGGRLPLSQLHGMLAVEKSTTTRIVAPLLKMGLLDKERSVEDKRAFDLVMTPEGEKTHSAVWECLSGQLQAMLGTMPAAEAGDIMRAVARFVQALEECCKG